jgi:hypothetical protein
MGVTVWLEGWQLECCGEPFKIGWHVDWTVARTDPDHLETILGAERVAGIPYTEEHHGGRIGARIEGVVRSIAVVRCRYAADPAKPRMFYPVSGSGVTTETTSAQGREPDTADDLRFVGYLVGLEPAEVLDP